MDGYGLNAETISQKPCPFTMERCLMSLTIMFRIDFVRAAGC